MALSVSDLTEVSLTGTGVFDTLMRATKAHLEEEYTQNRIRGAEYAQVYLGSLQNVLNASLQFVLTKQKAELEAKVLEQQAELLEQQKANAVIEGTVLTGQKCKLDAEFDNLVASVARITQETTLLGQKVVTEKAQTQGIGVDGESVIGKQSALYAAQTEGYKRDAEQKAANIMVNAWNTQRMTDEDFQANSTNMLDATSIGRVIKTLMAGIEA